MIPSILLSIETDAFLRFFSRETPTRNSFAGLIFVLTTAGQATVEIDGRPYTSQSGTLQVILPYHLLNTTMVTADFHCLTIAFTFDAIADFPYMLQSCISEKIEHTPVIHLTSDERERLVSLYNTIAAHYQLTAHPSYSEILCSFLLLR